MSANRFSRHLRLCLLPCLLLCLVAGVAGAQSGDSPPLELLVGSYDLVGKDHDSGSSYAGTMRISIEGDQLRLIRSIAGSTEHGVATLGYRTPDRISILEVEHEQAGEKLEAWCTLSVDLDNFPRATCLVRARGEETEEPGLEAWFHRGSSGGRTKR